MAKSFWKQALASLPPAVQRRHAAEFEAAERFERRLDYAIATWNSVGDALGRAVRRRPRAARRGGAKASRRLLMQ